MYVWGVECVQYNNKKKKNRKRYMMMKKMVKVNK